MADMVKPRRTGRNFATVSEQMRTDADSRQFENSQTTSLSVLVLWVESPGNPFFLRHRGEGP